jgi:hypothetical protein
MDYKIQINFQALRARKRTVGVKLRFRTPLNQVLSVFSPYRLKWVIEKKKLMAEELSKRRAKKR